MLIKACLNGSRAPEEHDALPVSPAELAKDAAECRNAGAGAVHIHPRGMGATETLEPDACAAAVEAIRDASPGLAVGLTTGLWIAGNSNQRLRLIEQWTVLPEFCSVNFSEDGTTELCRLLIDKGIAIEAGLSSVADARAFVDSGYVDHCLRVLIEVEPGTAEALRGAQVISRVLEGAGVRLPRLQHGMGADAWPLLQDGLARGYDVRIGLEDTLTMPDGSAAPGNAALVAAAAQLVSSLATRR